MGFVEIANVAVERWKAGRRNDAIMIPIIYNYRHGIELVLKAEIREAAACLRGDGVADPGVQVDGVNEWVSATHSIVVHMQRVSRGEVLDDRAAACPPPVEALMVARMHNQSASPWPGCNAMGLGAGM
jgi:hypothetical protein